MIDLIVISRPGRKLTVTPRTDLALIAFVFAIGESVLREGGIKIEIVLIDLIGRIDIEDNA